MRNPGDGDSYYKAESNSAHTDGAVLLSTARQRALTGRTTRILVHLNSKYSKLVQARKVVKSLKIHGK